MTYSQDLMKQAISELRLYGSQAVAKGLVSASGGNLSARIGDSNYCVITITGAWLDDLGDDQFAVLDVRDGTQVSGDAPPSSEYKVHTMSYARREDIKAVVHLHPQWTVLARALDVNIRPFSLDHYSYLGEIRTVPFSPNGSDELGIDVADAVGAGSDVVVLDNHGCVCVGAEVSMGYRRALNLEEASRAAIFAQLLGQPTAGFPVEGAQVHS